MASRALTATEARPRLVVVFGVCGCGKSSLGSALGERLGKPFLDADDFHPAANKAKMARGVPLSDADRWPWLDALGRALAKQGRQAGMAVAACSALRRAYRERLIEVAGEPILFVLLDGPPALIAERLARRQDHFMPPGLLDSQLALLEPPMDEERALCLDLAQPVPTLVKAVQAHVFAR